MADGYAQNYLFPQKMAKPATERNVSQVKAGLKKGGKKKSNSLPAAETAGRLRNLTLELSAKADENGTFFAGITRDKLAQELAKKKIPVKSKQIELAEPIKKAGNYKITVSIGDGVKGELNVITTEI